ncbi:Trs33 protein [Martiniozyma asiatica (nom. inval.)]|nr:Trs33 protein [Martiniozyma asiatica]
MNNNNNNNNNSIKDNFVSQTALHQLLLQIHNNDVVSAKSIGSSVGKRATLLLLDHTLEPTQTATMKFISSKIWPQLYGHQVESLRTDNNGTFVLLDSKLVPVMRCTKHKNYIEFNESVIKGVLQSLGYQEESFRVNYIGLSKGMAQIQVHFK